MKRKIVAKKNSIINFFTKKKFVEKNFRKKNFSKKKNSKKILKTIFAIFLFLKKKSVKSRLIHQSKDRKLSVNWWLIGTSVKISVNLNYFWLKHRLHNLPTWLKNIKSPSQFYIVEMLFRPNSRFPLLKRKTHTGIVWLFISLSAEFKIFLNIQQITY